MPATFSHPPAIVPFVRYGGILSAMAIGTMLPDIWHMVPEFLQRYETHTLIAQLNFTVPVGLFFLFTFHFWLKRPFLALLPLSMQQRLYGLVDRPFAWWPMKRFGAILVSLWLGGFIHILWDSFTHTGGWMVRHISPLRTVVFIPNNAWMSHDPVTVSWFLQHISS